VPTSLLELAARQEGLVSLAQCTKHGVSRQQVAGLVRRKEWDQVVRAVYDTGYVIAGDVDPYDRRRRRAAILGLLAHPGSVATGVCALVLRGVRGAPIDVEPEVAMPTGAPRAPRPPVRLRRVLVETWDDVGGLPCASVADALVQAVPRLSRFDAVALMDSAARHRPGIARTHAWWSQADARAESPAETWARLSCADLGYPPDVLQLPVAGRDGRVFARVDLAWLLPDGGALLVEIDGRDAHSTPSAVFSDRLRQNRLDTRRTIVRRFTGSEARRGQLDV
jgi:hypothetical protein